MKGRPASWMQDAAFFASLPKVSCQRLLGVSLLLGSPAAELRVMLLLSWEKETCQQTTTISHVHQFRHGNCQWVTDMWSVSYPSGISRI